MKELMYLRVKMGDFPWIFQPVMLHASELRGIFLAGLWHLSSIPGAIICDDAWDSTSMEFHC